MEVYNKSPLSCEICKSRLAPQEPGSSYETFFGLSSSALPDLTRDGDLIISRDLLSTFVVQFVNLLISCNFGL